VGVEGGWRGEGEIAGQWERGGEAVGGKSKGAWDGKLRSVQSEFS
jgi:hypothetical protein